MASITLLLLFVKSLKFVQSFILQIHPNVLIFTKGCIILVQVTMLDHLLDTVYVCQNFD